MSRLHFIVFIVTAHVFAFIIALLISVDLHLISPAIKSSDSFVAHKISFKGTDKGILNDDRRVVFETDEGDIVYYQRQVKYRESNLDDIAVKVLDFSNGSREVTVYLPTDKLKKVKSDYVKKFGSNLELE